MGMLFGSEEEDIPQKLYEKIESRISSLEVSIHRLHQEIQSLKYVLATKVDDRKLKANWTPELAQDFNSYHDNPKTSPAVNSFFLAVEKRAAERQKEWNQANKDTSSGFTTYPLYNEAGNMQCGFCGQTNCRGCFK